LAAGTQLSSKRRADDARVSLEKVLQRSDSDGARTISGDPVQLATSQNQDQVSKRGSRLEKLTRGPSATALDALVCSPARGFCAALSDVRGQRQTSQNLSTLNPQTLNFCTTIASDAIAAALDRIHWRKRAKCWH